jgi:hypothetical protein
MAMVSTLTSTVAVVESDDDGLVYHDVLDWVLSLVLLARELVSLLLRAWKAVPGTTI